MAAKPRVNPDVIVKAGVRALELALRKRRRIERRLPPGMLDGLAADIELFRDSRVAVKKKGSQIKAATGSVESVVDRTSSLCGSIRQLVKDAGAPADVRKAWGVGSKLSGSVSRVRAAAEVIIDRAEEKPEEARSIGILEEDLNKLKSLLRRLSDADDKQDQLLTTRRIATRERNAVGSRILKAVKRIGSAGAVEFENDPATVAEFQSLAPVVEQKKSSKKKSSPASVDDQAA